MTALTDVVGSMTPDQKKTTLAMTAIRKGVIVDVTADITSMRTAALDALPAYANFDGADHYRRGVVNTFDSVLAVLVLSASECDAAIAALKQP